MTEKIPGNNIKNTNSEKSEKQVLKEEIKETSYWKTYASQLNWSKPFETIRDDKTNDLKWFVSGKTNISYNCIDRHLSTCNKNKAAIIWESETGESRVLTYQMLHREVSRFANVLKKCGIKKGDCVTIYMGMVPELPIAMLACARIGAIHSVIFSGYSDETLKKRINSTRSVLLITSDFIIRRGGNIQVKAKIDLVINECESIQSIIVHKRNPASDLQLLPEKEFWLDDLLAAVTDKNEALQVDSEQPLFIAYDGSQVSSSNGIVHNTGGYMTAAFQSVKEIFEIDDNSVIWNAMDLSWITGHTYSIYGPLLAGITTFIYEGAANFPDSGKYLELIDKYKINVFYTAQALLKELLKRSDEWGRKFEFSFLNRIGIVDGHFEQDSINQLKKIIKTDDCRLIETWMQAETGIVTFFRKQNIKDFVFMDLFKQAPGIIAEITDEKGNEIENGQFGSLVYCDVFPSLARTIYGDKSAYRKIYRKSKRNIFFTGYTAQRLKDGFSIRTERNDEVINMLGYRISLPEIETALKEHPDVRDAAVLNKTDLEKGIIAFVVLGAEKDPTFLLKEELKNYVSVKIGSFVKPDEICFLEIVPRENDDTPDVQHLFSLYDEMKKAEVSPETV